MKKKCLMNVLLSLTLIFSLAALPVHAGEPSSWAASEVNKASKIGLVTESVLENPTSYITRAQFCEMSVIAYEKTCNGTATVGEKSFCDTDNSQILKAANLGIVEGYDDGSFHPGEYITREELSAILVRMLEKAIPYINSSLFNTNNFSDANQISDWAVPFVNFLYDKKLLDGIGENKIDPLSYTTCEEATVLLYRAFRKYSDRTEIITTELPDKTVTDAQSALTIIDNVSDMIGIESTTDELRYIGSEKVLKNTFYKFQQVYHDIPVYGRSITLCTDSDGKPTMLSENYKNINADLHIEIEEDSICKLATQLYNYSLENIMVDDLVIYSLHGTEPQLCWQIYVTTEDDESKFSFFSAHDGRFVAKSSLGVYEKAVGSGRDVDNKFCVFDTSTDDNETFYLQDSYNGIHVFDANNGNLVTNQILLDENKNAYTYDYEKNSWVDSLGNKVRYKLDPQTNGVRITNQYGELISDRAMMAWYLFIESNDNSTSQESNNEPKAYNKVFSSVTEVTSKSQEWFNKKAVTVMDRIKKNNDFYYELFGRSGYNGNFGKVLAVINDNMNGTVNSYSTGDWNGTTVLSFSPKSTLSYDLIAHEYRHSVTSSINNGLEYMTESGALDEAYSDIFGELFEDWVTDGVLDNSCNWIYSSSRNLKNPLESNNPYQYKGENWGNTDDRSKANDYGRVHRNSTVISHAAYLMCEGIETDASTEHLNNTQLAELFYTTAYFLSYTCKFNDFSEILYSVGRSMYNNREITLEQLHCIAKSLSEVNLAITNQAICGKIVSADKKALDGATVSFFSNNIKVKTVSTTKAGTFSAELPIGTYDIVIEKPGYIKTNLSASIDINELHKLSNEIILQNKK